MARRPESVIARSAVRSIAATLPVFMLPNPMQIGGGPADKKSASAVGGVQPLSAGSLQNPVTCMDGPKSAGGGTSDGLYANSIGRPLR